MTTAKCVMGHTLACVSGRRLGYDSFACDAVGCSAVIAASAERWSCAVCNHDLCDACEPAAAAAADAAADAAREAAGARLSAAVAAAAVSAVITAARTAEQQRSDVVRVRLSGRHWLRASRDWGGATLLLETKPPEIGFKDKYEEERQRRIGAQARAAVAEADAAEACRAAHAEKRRLEKAEARVTSLELQLAGVDESSPRELRSLLPISALEHEARVSKRARLHAETMAAAGSQAATNARAAAAASKHEARQAIETIKQREGRRVVEAEAEVAAAKRERDSAEARARASDERAVAADARAAESKKQAEKAAKAEAAAKAGAASGLAKGIEKTAKALEKAQAKMAAAEEAATRANERAARSEQRLLDLKEALGLEVHRFLPGSHDRKHGVPVLKSVLEGRPAAHVASALKGAGGTQLLSDLAQCQEFQPIIKSTIEETIKQIQARWSPRLAVLLMSDLQLSRRQFEALRNYLSWEYDVDDDTYRRLKLYVNPFNEQQYVSFPSLPPRTKWEPERDMLFGLCGVESSADGMVSYVKDQRGAVGQMVVDHWAGLSSNVKDGSRPLLVAGFGDATGGWRGSSITHFELGLCSWESTDVKQCSKSNLLPAALAEGDDGAENLRLRFQPVADGFNDLASGKPLDVELPSGRRQVQMDFTFCGDFQIHKAVLGMSKYTSTIFCSCDEDTTGIFKFRSMPATTWADVVAWYAEIDCVVKTIEKVCEYNHWSYEVLMGRPFKRMKCTQPGCSYEAKTQKQWQADVDALDKLEPAARKEATLAHGRLHKRHRPFMAPMLKHTPPLRMSVDILHIMFINMFVTYLEATVLCYVVELDAIGRQPIETYLASMQIHMKIVKANDVGEMKQSLIGRDAKVFMDRAEEIVPELLLFVRMPKADVQQVAAAAADVDSDEFTWGGDGSEGSGDGVETLETKVARRLPHARVLRVAAAERKGALLDKCTKLARINMAQFCSAEELDAKRGEIDAAEVLAVLDGSALLAFAAYLIHEREGNHVVTYLLELHRDVHNALSKGLGSDLEEEVTQLASEANEAMMLTVAEANSARAFYSKRGYWIDISSPQNHATASTRPKRADYIIMRKYPGEGESVHERDARFWDNFHTLSRSFRVFESDANHYREARAVETFNAATQVGHDVKVLRPTLKSACPHILADIVPRQIIEMGDPLSRGCDQSESVGANMKSTIHRRVARRKVNGKATVHKRHDASGSIVKQWTQKALKVSRVMQAFRSECVRERILRDPASALYLQRKHFHLLKHGRASKAPVKPERPDDRCIADAYVKRVRELQEEGGEPA